MRRRGAGYEARPANTPNIPIEEIGVIIPVAVGVMSSSPPDYCRVVGPRPWNPTDYRIRKARVEREE